MYPAVDYAYDTRSYQVNGQGMFLETASMRWFWDHYVDNTDLSGYNIFASPLRARLSNDLPPALVITAEFDPLRDEGEAYHAALEEAGVSTSLIRYDGVIHGFFGLPHVIDKGRQAIDAACASLQVAFGSVMEQPEAVERRITEPGRSPALNYARIGSLRSEAHDEHTRQNQAISPERIRHPAYPNAGSAADTGYGNPAP